MKKRKTSIAVIDSPVPFAEVLESEALILRFDAPLSGSIVILADMLCGECHRAGIMVVSVLCRSCVKAQVNRVMCLRSNVVLSHGTLTIPDTVVLCDECKARDDDTAPPIVGGPLRTFDTNRLN